MIGECLFECHDPAKARILVRDERSRGWKATFFWERLLLIFCAEKLGSLRPVMITKHWACFWAMLRAG